MFRNICLIFVFALAPSFAQAVRLKVDTSTVVQQIDPKIYGQFLEHIYHSVNGGVWGEVVWNRSFEERFSPEDWRIRAVVSWRVRRTSRTQSRFDRLSGTVDRL